MFEFFKPWYRRLGVLALILACGFTALWIHTMIMYAELKLPIEQPMPYSYPAVSLTVLAGCLLLAKSSRRSAAR